ncbi:MAG: hypothetical protein GX208_03505 [Firmicutes bacterium]|nr:hypothetical protein [Bacillota bacterium]
MKKKIYIPIIVSLCLAIFILNRTGAIDFGLQHLIARLWPIVIVWLGYNLLHYKEEFKKKSGIVLTIMGLFLLILNVSVLFFENQDYVFKIFFTGLLTFWPVLIIFLALHAILSIFDPGEAVYTSSFGIRNYEQVDLSKLDSTLKARFGRLKFVIDPKDLTHRAIRLNIVAFFGVVEVLVSGEVSLLAENKARVGFYDILGEKGSKLWGVQVVEIDANSDSATRLLLTINSWFGKVIVKKAEG